MLRSARITGCLLVATGLLACSEDEGATRESATPSGGESASGGASANAAETAASASPGDQPAKADGDGDPAEAAENAAVSDTKDPSQLGPRTLPSDGPRVFAKTRFVWIRPEPNAGGGWIGYLWVGGSVKLKTGEPVRGPGCGDWYEVEPRGFVCVDGKRATLDRNDPQLLAALPHSPDLRTAWPHRYGESRGVPRYDAIPTEAEQKAREYKLATHLERIETARGGGEVHSSLRAISLEPADAKPPDLGLLPATLREARKYVVPTSAVAYSARVHAHGRNWLLSADFAWMPADKVTPYPRVTFHGVELGDRVKLPLAFFRGEDRPKYRRSKENGFVETGEKFARLSHVMLTDERAEHDGVSYAKTRSGDWLRVKDAVIPKLREHTPWGAVVGEKDDTGRAPEGHGTWMEASVWGGWLLAYEGTKPVYATLISPGRGGTPVPGKTALETASTPTGTFKITGKFATATMVAPGDLIHSDVPWTQNFSGPHALHGAYWHDDWGNRKSAGCVNVSPLDGKWLWGFTEPRPPEGWHGVRWRPQQESATTFIVGD